MTGPAWLAAGFAAVSMLIAGCCAGRLVGSRLRGRDTELDADVLHVLMGVAMAGMLEPRLSPLPAAVWRAVFAAAAAWFGWQAIRARARGRGRPAGSRCLHPAPHAVECVAMVYMLWPASGHMPGTTMPGMTGSAGATGDNPALVLVLALFMLGYILWTTDRLTAASRARPASAARGAAEDRQRQSGPASAAPGPPGAARTTHAGQVDRQPLAPRLAACYKIAMSIAMGYMLVTML